MTTDNYTVAGQTGRQIMFCCKNYKAAVVIIFISANSNLDCRGSREMIELLCGYYLRYWSIGSAAGTEDLQQRG